MPTGGYYTIDARGATQLCDKLKPRVIFPMHYRTDKYNGPLTGIPVR
ncbi:MBL fold metallo-hydrolase [Chloroflexota bacterium]